MGNNSNKKGVSTGDKVFFGIGLLTFVAGYYAGIAVSVEASMGVVAVGVIVAFVAKKKLS